MKSHPIIRLCGVLILSSCTATAVARTWSDSTGTHKIEGEFVKLSDGKVEIRGDDGKVVRVVLEKLSQDDQKFARKAGKSVGNETPFAVASDEEKPAAKPNEPVDGKDPQTVVADGVGTTADEALKDAFTNAVRQVVGTVVDAETMVKNDELIKDQVLTYSDGFIPHYDKVSEKQNGGVIRVTIRAQVERRSVVQKLKAANVSLKEVEGKGLFAEAVTQLDAEKNARRLVAKSLDGFPLNCLECELTGKPKLLEKDDNKATIGFEVVYRPNLKAYDSFAKSLTQMLKRVAKSSGEFSLQAPTITESSRADSGKGHSKSVKSTKKESSAGDLTDSAAVGTGTWHRLTDRPTRRSVFWEKAIPEHAATMCSEDWKNVLIAVNTQRASNNERTEWRYYVLDEEARFPLAAAAACVLSTKVSLLDDQGGIVTVDRFPAVLGDRGKGRVRGKGPKAHASLIYNALEDSSYYDAFWLRDNRPIDDFHSDYFADMIKTKRREHAGPEEGIVPRLYVIAPFIFTVADFPLHDDYCYSPALTVSRKLTISLEELKKIDRARCELLFKGTLPADAKE